MDNQINDKCNCLVNYNADLAGKIAEKTPLVIDDNLIMQGEICAAGSKMLYNFRPPFQSESVARAIAAGYAPIARANIGEFSMDGSGESSCFGPVTHPDNTDYCAGGAAAAVRQNIAPAALIVDCGGLGLKQAALTGCAAFRPTYGSISRFGIIANVSSSEQVGAVSMSVAETARLVQAVAGHDDKDATSLPEMSFTYTTELPAKGMNIALITNCDSELSDEEKHTLTQAVERLRTAGATVEEVSLTYFSLAKAAFTVMAAAEGCNNISRFDGVKYGYRTQKYHTMEELYCGSRSEAFSLHTKFIAMLGTYVLSKGHYEQYYRKALQARRLIKDEFNLLFQTYDVALLPAATATAYPLGADAQQYLSDKDCVYTAAPAISGLPAVAIPFGHAANGLPLTIQITADAYNDNKALSVARLLEGGCA